MARYVLGRLIFVIPTLLGISFLVFALLHFSPGDPARLILGPDAHEDQVVQLQNELGLNDPLVVQYGRYLANALQGDLGLSYTSKRSVVGEILPTFPATLQLATAGTLVAILVGVPIGIISATRPYSVFDQVSMAGAILGMSTPIFFTGLVFIVVFAGYIPLFPTSGYGTWQHIIMPAVTLGLASAAFMSRITRSALLEVLGEDYVQTARAKGLSESVVIFRHAFKNASIPVSTAFGIQFGHLLAGSVIVETVFAWPGIGRLIVTAILGRDAPVVAGAVLLVAALIVLVNLLVDLAYVLIDPRIRYD